MDIAQAFNRPQDLDLAGRTFPVRQLTLEEWGDLQAWLKRSCPSPMTQALRAAQEARDLGLAISSEVSDAMFEQAQGAARKWPPRIASRAWLRAVESVEDGSAHFLQAVLQHGGTTVSLDEARELIEASQQEQVNDLVRLAYYGDPPGPKADTPAIADTTPTTATEPSPIPPAKTGDPSSSGSVAETA